MKESDSFSSEKPGKVTLENVSSLSPITAIDTLQSGFVTSLNQLGILRLSGEDAVHFLQGQFTSDVERMGLSEASMTGYCTPKGRLLASPLIWKSQKDVYLALPKEILTSLQKRLQMYVLRANVKLLDESEELILLGLGGKNGEKVLSRWFDELPTKPYEKKEGKFGTLIRMTNAFSVSRYLWAANLNSVHTIWDALASELQPVHENSWYICNISAGIPQIVAATQDQFVPQMVNLEVVGGLSFQKGCYTGQEIVARSQYRGKIRRRMLPAYTMLSAEPIGTVGLLKDAVQAGNEIYSGSDPEQPCGTVVNVARRDAQRIDLLVVMHADFLSSERLHLGSVEGSVVHLGSLPYALPDDYFQADV